MRPQELAGPQARCEGPEYCQSQLLRLAVADGKIRLQNVEARAQLADNGSRRVDQEVGQDRGCLDVENLQFADTALEAPDLLRPRYSRGTDSDSFGTALHSPSLQVYPIRGNGVDNPVNNPFVGIVMPDQLRSRGARRLPARESTDHGCNNRSLTSVGGKTGTERNRNRRSRTWPPMRHRPFRCPGAHRYWNSKGETSFR
jgi:hypothetical protein